IAARPPKFLRALPVTFAEFFTRKWQVIILVALSVVLQSQLEGIPAKLHRQFVHRTLQSINSPTGAGRAHVDRRVKIEWHDLMLQPNVRTLVKQTRPVDNHLAEILESGGFGDG